MKEYVKPEVEEIELNFNEPIMVVSGGLDVEEWE